MLYPQYFIDDLKSRSYVALIITTLILLIIFVIDGVAQEKPKAVQVDEFGQINCEDLLARTDNLGTQLQLHPAWTGIVVIYGAGDKLTRYPGEFVHRSIIGRWGLQLKLKVFRIESNEMARTQFWLVQDESDLKIPNAQLVASVPFMITERFLFGSETGDPCSDPVSYGFADALKSNQGYKGQIVDFNVPTSRRPQAAAEWLKEFKEKYNIPRNRLRIYFKDKKNQDYRLPLVQFWILPIKRQ